LLEAHELLPLQLHHAVGDVVLMEQPNKVILDYVACIRVDLLVTLPPSKSRSHQLLHSQQKFVSIIGVHHVQLHLNLAELVIHLNRVARPSKLQWAKSVKIHNPVNVRVWAMLNISLPSVVLIHHSIGQEL
jgi:hypothetical protein